MRYYLAFHTVKCLRCHVAEADKKTVEVELITGEETEALAKEVINQPPEIVARLKRSLGE